MSARGAARSSARVALKGVSRSFGATRAVRDLSFAVEAGEFFSLLGPSGCGKTTALRLIAGLERPDSGKVLVGDEVVAGEGRWLGPERRGVGVVFQDYALFPHLTVGRNVAFGLKGWSRHDARARVAELLALTGLEGLEKRYPHELSGGQSQRVALARSMAPAPGVMLLDEPFSNLDADLREELRIETRRILKEQGATAILVTHEQEEAFSLSDHVGVLEHGCLQQVGRPSDIYRRPATRFVADFLGKGDFLPGVVENRSVTTAIGVFPLDDAKWRAGSKVELMLRPGDVDFAPDPDGAAVITEVRFLGASAMYELTMPDGLKLRSLKSSARILPPGTRGRLKIDVAHIVVFPRESGA